MADISFIKSIEKTLVGRRWGWSRRFAASFVPLLGLLLDLYGQAFQNLNFEANLINLGSNSFLGPLYAIPDWTVNFNGAPQTGLPDFESLDETGAALIAGPGAIDGNQSVNLVASSYEAPVGGSSSESISQSGTVPNTAQLIEFKLASIQTVGIANKSLPQNYFFIMLNSRIIPIQILTNTGSFIVLGGNVSRWAGLTAQLTIGVQVPYSYPHDLYEILFYGAIDDVAFISGPANLSISNPVGGFVVSSSNTGNYILQQNNDIASAAGWTASAYAITTNANNTSSITVTTRPTGNLFFRLISP